MATFALLQASIVAVSSDSFSGVRANPDENRTSILRPGTPRRFFARLRIASSMVRAPKSASALLSDEMPLAGSDCGESPADATVRGSVEADALESTEEYLTPLTAAVSASALAVKF